MVLSMVDLFPDFQTENSVLLQFLPRIIENDVAGRGFVNTCLNAALADSEGVILSVIGKDC